MQSWFSRLKSSCVPVPAPARQAHFLPLAGFLAAGFAAAGFFAAAAFLAGAAAGFFAAAGLAAGFGAGAGGAGAGLAAGAAAAAGFFAAGAACVVKNEVSTSKIVHTNDGKCARCGDAKAPAAAASTRLRLCGRLGFGGSRLQGRGCARRRGVMNAQFAHQAREQCGSVAQPSTARAFATLAGLGATAFAAGAGFAAALAGVAFLAGVFAMAARAGVGSATLAFAPAGAARAARGAPGERKSDANGVGRRAGWRRRPNGLTISTSAALSRSATRSALRDPRRGAQYVQEVRINACAAPRRVAAYAGSSSSLPQRGLQAAPEAYAPDAIRAGLPSTKQ